MIEPKDITDDDIILHALWNLRDDMTYGDVWRLQRRPGFADDVDDEVWNAVWNRVDQAYQNYVQKTGRKVGEHDYP